MPSCGFPFSSTGFMITQYCLLLRVVMRTIPTTSSCTPGMWVSVSLNLISHSSPFFLMTFLESVNVLNAFKCRAFYKTKLNVTVYDNITPIFGILLIIHVVSVSLKAKYLQQTINIFNQQIKMPSTSSHVSASCTQYFYCQQKIVYGMIAN